MKVIILEVERNKNIFINKKTPKPMINIRVSLFYIILILILKKILKKKQVNISKISQKQK